MVGSGQSLALWQHMPGLTSLSVFLAERDGGADLFLVLLYSSSHGPVEFTLAKLGTLEAALTIVKQEIALLCSKEGLQGMACQLQRQRCETGTPSHPYTVFIHI